MELSNMELYYLELTTILGMYGRYVLYSENI